MNVPRKEFISIHEMRRRAPLHYWAKADNARLSAYLLWQLMRVEESSETGQTPGWQLSRYTGAIGYNGNPSIALYEAFRREGSIALELIVKAVIAQLIERGTAAAHVKRVRPTHNLGVLWQEASLPPLPREDHHRLLIATRILKWAGRYAAPTKDENFDREQREIDELEDRKNIGGLKFITPRSFGWEDVDRIYQTAIKSFCETEA